MFLSVLLFVAGIVAVQQFTKLPGVPWIVALAFLAISFIYFRHCRLMFFVIGLLWAICFSSVRISDVLPSELEGQVIEIEGKVIGLPKYNEERVKFDFKVLKPEKNFPSKIKLSWYYPKRKIKSGQNWVFIVKLKQPHGRFNPDQFDYERWLFIENIGATGYVKNKPKPKLIIKSSLVINIDQFRQIMTDKLTEIAGKKEFIGVIKALTIGERSEISTKQWQLFRNTGTVHLLAISGLHIGLIAGFSYLLIRKIAIRMALTSPQIIAATISIVVALFYSALAGFSLPTQRALLMLLVVMTATTWQRNITAANTLAISMFVVLIADPVAVLSAGFWLSYVAVVFIVFSLAGRLAKARYWVGMIKTHCVTAIGLSPLLIYYFQQISIVAPLANLIAVPVISLLVVPLCLIAVIGIFFFPLIAESLFSFIDYILQALWHVLSLLNDLPYAAVNVPSIPFYILPLAIIAAFILIAPRGVPARWLSVVILLPLFAADVTKPRAGEIKLTLLDVGQGLATVIETTNHVLVFDTGAKYSKHSDMGAMVVVPVLKNKGINGIDTLIISHGDNDHIGGATTILSEMPVKKLLTSSPSMLDQHNPVQCLAGQLWHWDKVKFEILSPQINKFVSENDNSCVLKITTNQGSFLLTGDIEAAAEYALTKTYPKKIQSDVLVAPHHGSRTSSTLSFLKHVKPRIVLIPAGYKNRFNFPHQEVLQRYKDMAEQVLNVADEGAIIVESDIDKYVLISTRTKQGKYWN